MDAHKRTPLHFAVVNGVTEIVQLILKSGGYIDAKGKWGETPLHVAVVKGSIKIIELLISHGAYIDAKDYRDRTPLHIAVAKECSEEIINLLLSSGASVNAKVEDGIAPLHIAAKKGHMRNVETLLNNDACITSLTIEEGYTPLHFACERDNEKIVKLFLDRDADINATTKSNETPLHIATKSGCERVVKLLLQHGAKVDSQDKDGQTVLYLAVKKMNFTIVQEILKYSPDINNQSNRNSLKVAVLSYSKMSNAIFEALLEYGFYLDVSPDDANNPDLLHAAVRSGYSEIVEGLLKCGADANMLCNSTILEEGFTPLHSAAKSKQVEVAQVLINYKANINAQDKAGNTPLFYAIENNDLKIFKLLLANGANVRDRPDLLNIAVVKKCVDIIETLLQHGADINASDKFGRTALHFTALSEDEYNGFYYCLDQNSDSNIRGQIAKLLVSKGANVDAQDEGGLTTLHAAAYKGYAEVVEALLKCKANVNCEANGFAKRLRNGWMFQYDKTTALHFASDRGYYKIVLALLEYGADINIASKSNITPLRYAIDAMHYYRFDRDPDLAILKLEVTAKTLVRHIVSMKNANFYVSEANLSMSHHPAIKNFSAKCEEELANMKSEKINNCSISYFNILAKSTHSIAIYARNENIVQLLKTVDYDIKFPIYAGVIRNRLRKGMERKELLEQGNKIFNILFKNVPQLPYECKEEILRHLSEEDLKILLDTFKNLDICSFNYPYYEIDDSMEFLFKSKF